TTLGIRISEVERVSLQREETTIDTPYGPLSAKRATLPDGTTKARPEYDSMKRMAEEKPGFRPRDPEQRP
ncbi:MAG: LarC family nickel insertion protein, partial [Armatimonadetes bacterium]|nr:LarC family nickel insertion protein [Armatimonadota bacterium]